MIRLILALLTAVVLLIFPGIPLLLWMLILKQFNPQLKTKQSFVLVRAIFRLLLFICGVKLDISGRENIPSDRPALYVCNHRSNFDIIIATQYISCPTGFVAKKEMRVIPLLVQWMHAIECVFIDRENPKAALRSINDAIENVNHGTSMWIFPEGTRNHENEMLPFKEGSFRIAEKTGCPIIPIAMRGTDDIWENHFPSVRPAKIKVQIGVPIETSELDRKQKKGLAMQTQAMIKEMYDGMK